MGVLMGAVCGGNCFWREMFEICRFLAGNCWRQMLISAVKHYGGKIQAMCIFRIFAPKLSHQNVFPAKKNASYEQFGGN